MRVATIAAAAILMSGAAAADEQTPAEKAAPLRLYGGRNSIRER
jgi:hypothetical protein